MFVPPVVVDDSCTKMVPVAHLIVDPFGFSLKVNVDVVVPLPPLHVIVALPFPVAMLCLVVTLALPPVTAVGVQPVSFPVLDVCAFPVVVRVLHVAAAAVAEATPVVSPTVPSVEAASSPAIMAARVDRRNMNESPFDLFCGRSHSTLSLLDACTSYPMRQDLAGIRAWVRVRQHLCRRYLAGVGTGHPERHRRGNGRGP